MWGKEILRVREVYRWLEELEERFISVGMAYMTQAIGFMILEIGWLGWFYIFMSGGKILETSTLKIITLTPLCVLTTVLLCWSYMINLGRIKNR